MLFVFCVLLAQRCTCIWSSDTCLSASEGGNTCNTDFRTIKKQIYFIRQELQLKCFLRVYTVNFVSIVECEQNCLKTSQAGFKLK